MPCAIISAGVNRLRLILGIQPQGNAYLIERHVDPVGMNLNSCGHGVEDRAQLLGVDLLPGGGEPHRLVQKPLLGNSVRPATLDRVQYGDRIGESRADPVSNQSLDLSGRNALTPPLRFSASSQQRFGDVVSIADTLLYRMSGRYRLPTFPRIPARRPNCK